MGESRQRLGLRHEVHSDDEAANGLFLARVLEDGLREVRNEDWATTSKELPELGSPLLRITGEGGWCEFHYIVDPEASAWLAGHGIEGEADRATLLASLFARIEERDPGQRRRRPASPASREGAEGA